MKLKFSKNNKIYEKKNQKLETSVYETKQL